MSKQSNIIVFFTDQQRWDCSGLHGNPLDLMPNFDRVAQAGTHVSKFFTCQPVCGPARACLQTGQYASVNGTWRNGIPLTREVPPLARYFNEAGYQTSYIGKWHLADAREGPVEPNARGEYQDWLASNVLEFTSTDYETFLYDNDGTEVKLPGYRVDAMTDAAIRYIDTHQDDPFLLYLSYIEPHHQNHIDDYPAPDGYRERYTGRWMPPDLAALGGTSDQHLGGYYGMVKRLDEAFGRIMDALKSLRMAEDTIVVFISDHGCHFKTRNSEYKRSCHESSLRVPCLMHGGPFKAGGKIDELVSLIDIPPTLLDAAGIDVPDHMQGRSVLPLIQRDPHVEWPREVFFETSEAEIGRGIRTERWKYHVTAAAEDADDKGGADAYTEAFLYDLQGDPHELKNLAGCTSHRELSDILKERLLARFDALGQPRPTIRDAEPFNGGQRSVSLGELESLGFSVDSPSAGH